MTINEQLESALAEISKELIDEKVLIQLKHPEDLSHGEYATNLALLLSSRLKRPPLKIAHEIRQKLEDRKISDVTSISVAGPGFINIFLSESHFITQLERVLSGNGLVKSSNLNNKKIMVEYAHPNTHKEMHIGHMRTLITGEAVARLLHSAGAKVFRANYQGDIGPHIAKALYGIEVLTKERDVSLDTIESWSSKEKTHFLGEGYARGNKDYEDNKDAIDNINMQLYAKSSKIAQLYERTRKWNLEYYEEFYSRFAVRFDRLFFESEMAEEGRRIVLEHVGDVFTKENGAVIFKGETYGLHTRVFITTQGYPLYEAKDVANAFKQYEVFPFDLNIHVVASEQKGYFDVVFKALELLDPEKFRGSEYHLSMGMVQLADRKMSSRTGDVLTVDWLLDQVRLKVEELMSDARMESEEKAEVIEQIVIGAVKYSVLKVGTGQDASFDINRSVSLEGDSGPYLQYTYARTQSVIRKTDSKEVKVQFGSYQLAKEEIDLLHHISRFAEIANEAAEKYSPNILCTYLYQLASSFNLFYQKHQILKAEGETRQLRLGVTRGVGNIIKEGLHLLGIESPERM